MKVLVFDTETTGLPAGRNLSVRDVGKWPHIIQLSYILYDTEQNKTHSCVDDIIKLDAGVYISEKSIEMHGITRSVSLRKGIDIKDAIYNFNKTLQEADTVIEKQSASGKIYHKFPTLSELHEHLFGFTPNNTHDSMSDVLICFRCYYVLVNDKDVVTGGCSIIKNLYNLYCN